MKPQVFTESGSLRRHERELELEEEYCGPAITRDMELVKKACKELGERYPEALFLPTPSEGSAAVWEAMQVPIMRTSLGSLHSAHRCW